MNEALAASNNRPAIEPGSVTTARPVRRDESRDERESASAVSRQEPGARSVVRGAPSVIEYLNMAVRHELTAVNQYLHYRLLENWGYRVLAEKWRREAIEGNAAWGWACPPHHFMQVLDELHIGPSLNSSAVWGLNSMPSITSASRPKTPVTKTRRSPLLRVDI
jgi:hypothetical protein